MEYFLLKLVPIFLIYLTTFSKPINCQCENTISTIPVNSAVTNKNNLKFGILFDQETKIKTGDFMECEVTKSYSQESIKNDIHVFTQSSTNYAEYIFYPVSRDKKCFSFQVRTKLLPHIILSATASFVEIQKLEVILEYTGSSVIRTKGNVHASTTPIKGIVNDKELRGFWIRWLDDYLLEVGRDGDSYPILSYRSPEKLSINFIGIYSHTTSAQWILHQDPKCGAYNISEKIEAEAICKVRTIKLNSEKINTLEKSQQHILNQIKNQHGIFNVNKLRSKEILLEYQESIKKLYRNAEENQNKIYEKDNDSYCPLKAITFNEITQEYWQFMAELKMELASFSQTLPTEINGLNNFGHCSGCCGSNIL